VYEVVAFAVTPIVVEAMKFEEQVSVLLLYVADPQTTNLRVSSPPIVSGSVDVERKVIAAPGDRGPLL
jgi:hypothetical protein